MPRLSVSRLTLLDSYLFVSSRALKYIYAPDIGSEDLESSIVIFLPVPKSCEAYSDNDEKTIAAIIDTILMLEVKV
ncbi:MAG: hypothetical protein Kapaf2KO_16180 [Candidatus Kapaibacteriales bacterium]